MKKVLLAAAALACMGGTALAGVNANGSLILALADGVVYTTDIEDYCGATGLQSCSNAIAQTDGTAPVVMNVIAAFPSVANPRLTGVVFGWVYGSDITLIASAGCGDFELPNAAWPASGEGTAVTWGVAQTTTLTDVYWVAAYNYYGNAATLDLTPHPQQGASFADDSVPAILDPIAALGSFGFSTPGNVPCPPEVADGACCFSDGTCEVLSRDGCAAAGGSFEGDGTACDPNPCDQPATGACCVGEICSTRTAAECDAAGGSYLGDNEPCDPNPCFVPVEETSWGSLKGIYR